MVLAMVCGLLVFRGCFGWFFEALEEKWGGKVGETFDTGLGGRVSLRSEPQA